AGAGAGGAAGDLALVAGLAALAGLAAAGLYPGMRLEPAELLRRRTLALAAAAALAGATAALVLHNPRAAGVALIMLALALPLQLLLRELLLRGLHALGLWAVEAEFLGPPERAAAAGAEFARNWRLGLVPGRAGTARVAVLVGAGLPEAGRLAGLRARYDELFLPADRVGLKGAGLLPVDMAGASGLRLRPPAADARGPGALARLRDIAVAGPALVLLAPLLLVAAALVWRADPGPVLFRQERAGLHGRPVRIWKLRTMYRDADRMLAALLDRDPGARREWEAHFKLRDDPRLLPGIGRLFRATSLDELPQLVNVLAGEMTLVGPRPFPEYHLEAMPRAVRAKRATVVPGLTGLWQVSERAEADAARQQELDAHYIDTRTAWSDVVILFRTVRAVLGGTGA
uniref:sugar transferase n=1 Tax=Oceanicella sp. SM1341 TaxID=1548889 RepID=UPI001300AB65